MTVTKARKPIAYGEPVKFFSSNGVWLFGIVRKVNRKNMKIVGGPWTAYSSKTWIVAKTRVRRDPDVQNFPYYRYLD